VKGISSNILPAEPILTSDNIKTSFNDDEIEDITELLESLDNSILSGTNRDTLKLRLYFKPGEVVDFLVSRGVTHKAFY